MVAHRDVGDCSQKMDLQFMSIGYNSLERRGGTTGENGTKYSPVIRPTSYEHHLEASGGSNDPVNAMTVDVEDYFQVSAFDPYIKRSDWDSFETRVENNVEKILQMFDAVGIRGTFFILGWIAEKHPDMVRRIADAGHEIASHGWFHYRVSSQKPEEFLVDILNTRKLLEDISGQAVKGYRAPSYSVVESTPWAHDILSEAGYAYSSSIMPIKHDHYGIPHAPRFEFIVNPSNILEIPITTVRFRDKNYPCGGGGWFRLYPYELSKLALKYVNQREKRSCVFYFHPWEVDPEQPRMNGLDAKTRFRHYVNLSRCEAKLRALSRDFKWGRMDEIFLEPSLALRNIGVQSETPNSFQQVVEKE